ncbi:MAG: pyridoxal-phosphate dependent enzyme [Rhodothermaceae bacterium]|nr:pyridoxal-phosphate dependent enzyme [Rhodothermaceae bacterium]MXW31760.1 pyridoxal-phosphate dependent enzyme [Rhodothermaceae bacterium]MYC03205.1 pyridoxal-phosphate dependent enzyme [Rhodothermaceae bacterium]MYE62938.1 pyridoxal-phosphate dependent enzyme [Rhodothermaceae bacterium]MYI16889.1 pyridoxal-phosphate dependent enzyme [Rhodothermaceae bacterium]
MTARDVQALLEGRGDPVRATHSQGFFKTGPGEYGEGDIFRGITVPELRKVARCWKKVPLEEMTLLLQSPYHEDRFVALCLLVHSFQHGNEDTVYHAYLEHLPFINNWDLVDTSCHKIVGPYLFKRPRTLLYLFARSKNLWERRIAIVSTYYFIKRDQLNDTLALADLLSGDPEDLIHKASGWMLREVGKRDESVLVEFLNNPTVHLPRTALRYAIERFPAPVRKEYLQNHAAGVPAQSMTQQTPHWRAYRYVMDAAVELKGGVVQTPVLQSDALARSSGADVYLKLENEQHTGSFKYRGALNKLLSLGVSPPPVIGASTGNHGLAMSMVLRELELEGTIFLPSTTAKHKVNSLRNHDINLAFHGKDGIEAEQKARHTAEREGGTFISPYNDLQIIAGQGTVAVELLEQIESLDYLFASVGGGGLISGIALVLKTHLPTIMIVGCSPERSNVMQKSVEAGVTVEQPLQPTLSDGTAGGIEADSLTLPLCMELVDDWVSATEEEIASAMRLIYREHGIKIEGAAGVTVACFLKYGKCLTGKRVALIICGGNISDEHFDAVLSQDS